MPATVKMNAFMQFVTFPKVILIICEWAENQNKSLPC